MESNADYPYTGKDGHCKYNADSVKFKPTEYVQVPTHDNGALIAAVT
jgi:hypothetical protein